MFEHKKSNQFHGLMCIQAKSIKYFVTKSFIQRSKRIAYKCFRLLNVISLSYLKNKTVNYGVEETVDLWFIWKILLINACCLQCNFSLWPNDLSWRYAIFGFRIKHISLQSKQCKYLCFTLSFFIAKMHCQRNWVISRMHCWSSENQFIRLFFMAVRNDTT